jgi:hypothetical protein
MKLPMLKQDKANHLIYGLIIFGLFKVIFNPLIGIMMCTIFGLSKEIYDYLHKDAHTPDIYDAIATIVGGIIGLLILI